MYNEDLSLFLQRMEERHNELENLRGELFARNTRSPGRRNSMKARKNTKLSDTDFIIVEAPVNTNPSTYEVSSCVKFFA